MFLTSSLDCNSKCAFVFQICQNTVALPFPDGGEIFGAVPSHPGSITWPTTQEANGERQVIDKKISSWNNEWKYNSWYFILIIISSFFPQAGKAQDDDFQKAEDFVKNIKLLYTTTLSVSSEKSPTCVQILPILTKLEAHFTVAEEDTLFTSALKEKV